jgi:hypothetical protein
LVVKSTGGGSGAVGASSHAACARFRATDPLVTGLTRRNLAKVVGFPDVAGGIPEARWMRAMTFERLVRDKRFASEVATTTVGRLQLPRPSEVVVVSARVKVDRTAELLSKAHDRAVSRGAATLIYGLAVPFVGFEGVRATDVKPDFAVVAPKTTNQSEGSWLIVGDAKDYERLRSRVEDMRLLEGFLQVAVGAESCTAWSRLPHGMDVHQWGVLAVPRNSFLQPEALVEEITDHRAEIAMRIQERRDEAEGWKYDESTPIIDFVSHMQATFDPSACASCTLFGYCRNELRNSADPTNVLIEIGVARDVRAHVVGLVDGTGTIGAAPASVIANVTATVDNHGQNTGQFRVDPAGLPGTINVVIAKSDAAALGLHGMAVQRITAKGRGAWSMSVYKEPQSPATRQAVMKALGKELLAAMAEMAKAENSSPQPVYVVVPDRTTADVLASIADNLAGVELSRLRWERDRKMGRPALTYNGDPATLPAMLPEAGRTAVSFFLEEDRARAMTLRCPIVDVRVALARHVVAGGPAVNSMRLDYLLGWVDEKRTVAHRKWSDEIEQSEHTPGARLANTTSDQIHQALVGDRKRGGAKDPERYKKVVEAELKYKCGLIDQALDSLNKVPDSRLRDAYRSVESDAQIVWRRRLSLHASDLVRFGRTYRWWRNSQVPAIESDRKCAAQMLALANPQAAHDLATSAGTRQVAFATVISVNPLVLDVESRTIGDGSRIVLLHSAGVPCVELPWVAVDTSPKGSFKLIGLSIGPLQRASVPNSAPPTYLGWSPDLAAVAMPGDRWIVADFAWFSKNKGNKNLNVDKPKPDDVSAPKTGCTATSYDDAPALHRFCCRSHESAETEFSDDLADRRARGELNPQTWPPVRDGDAFEVSGMNEPVGNAFAEPSQGVPDDITIDDVE